MRDHQIPRSVTLWLYCHKQQLKALKVQTTGHLGPTNYKMLCSLKLLKIRQSDKDDLNSKCKQQYTYPVCLVREGQRDDLQLTYASNSTHNILPCLQVEDSKLLKKDEKDGSPQLPVKVNLHQNSFLLFWPNIGENIWKFWQISLQKSGESWPRDAADPALCHRSPSHLPRHSQCFPRCFSAGSPPPFVFPDSHLSVQVVSTADANSLWASKFYVPVACFLLFNIGDYVGRCPVRSSVWISPL